MAFTLTTRNIHSHFIQRQYTVYVLTIFTILLISQFTVLIYVHARVYSIAVCTISVVIFKKQSLKNWESTVTALWAGRLRFNSSRVPRPTMWPNQPLIQRAQGFSPPRVKRSAHEANQSPPSSSEINNAWSYIFTVWGLINTGQFSAYLSVLWLCPADGHLQYRDQAFRLGQPIGSTILLLWLKAK